MVQSAAGDLLADINSDSHPRTPTCTKRNIRQTSTPVSVQELVTPIELTLSDLANAGNLGAVSTHPRPTTQRRSRSSISSPISEQRGIAVTTQVDTIPKQQAAESSGTILDDLERAIRDITSTRSPEILAECLVSSLESYRKDEQALALCLRVVWEAFNEVDFDSTIFV